MSNRYCDLLASGNRPKHVECYSKINKFEKLVHLVRFTIEIHYDARAYERQI